MNLQTYLMCFHCRWKHDCELSTASQAGMHVLRLVGAGQL